MLDEAWSTDSCHVVTVVGGWGMGKSTLIHEWLNRMADDGYRDAGRVLGWSFRGQGSEEHVGGDDFFHQALACLDDHNPDVGLEQGKAYLNLGPAHDQIIVNELFMAQCNRLNGNFGEADNHLKRAEAAVGPFVLLNMDCLLEECGCVLPWVIWR